MGEGFYAGIGGTQLSDRTVNSRRLLDVASVTTATACVLAGGICAIGASAKGTPWIYGASFIVAALVAMTFVLTAAVLAVTSRSDIKERRRLRTIAAAWWKLAPSAHRWVIAIAAAVGIALTVIGIAGSPQHADLVTRAGDYFLITDAGDQQVSRAAYDQFLFSRYVLGLCGPSIALGTFVLAILRAFSTKLARPDLFDLATAGTTRPVA
ncbi:hypothetical protein AB4Z18_02420 [Leifsonia sp. 2TAF2]|uniref:hypothetical protein n=1 Tax=Leifsonia sp. 2TAF2 TaxID=3233009 RepID=UPI003F9BECA9